MGKLRALKEKELSQKNFASNGTQPPLSAGRGRKVHVGAKKQTEQTPTAFIFFFLLPLILFVAVSSFAPFLSRTQAPKRGDGGILLGSPPPPRRLILAGELGG